MTWKLLNKINRELLRRINILFFLDPVLLFYKYLHNVMIPLIGCEMNQILNLWFRHCIMVWIRNLLCKWPGVWVWAGQRREKYSFRPEHISHRTLRLVFSMERHFCTVTVYLHVTAQRHHHINVKVNMSF